MFDIVNVSFHFFHLYGTVLTLSRTIIFLWNHTHPVHSTYIHISIQYYSTGGQNYPPNVKYNYIFLNIHIVSICFTIFLYRIIPYGIVSYECTVLVNNSIQVSRQLTSIELCKVAFHARKKNY